ncbi:MAG: glycoside hydrolase family 2 TIM barrel-domain containing protein [bacterium]
MKLQVMMAAALIAVALSAAAEESTNPLAAAPSKTMIQMSGTRYQFLVNYSPYLIKGAFATHRLKDLAAAGANCVVAPDLETADGVLNHAKDAGIMGAVVVRLEPDSGMIYSSTQAVAAAIEKIRPHIQRLKTHPRLIAWIITSRIAGAERQNTVAYHAVNELARMLHQEDPNHTVISDVGLLNLQDPKAKLSAAHCPEVDVLGWTPGRGITNLVEVLDGLGWYKPFVILRAGIPHPNAVDHASWGSPLEPIPANKVVQCLNFFTNTMPAAVSLCLGSIIYNWDPSPLVTPTWYSLHHADGARAELVDVMTFAWTGKYPSNRCPVITVLTSAANARLVLPGLLASAQVVAADPDGDPLTYTWLLAKEIKGSGDDGQLPAEFSEVADALPTQAVPKITFMIPSEAGPYRLFAYVRDNKGHVSSANIPFLVEATRAPLATPAADVAQPPDHTELRTPAEEPEGGAVIIGKPARVTIEKTGVGGGWQLVVDRQPYFVKGAGGRKHLPELKAAGANTIRTWSTDFVTPVLDEANKYGLKVCIGLWMKQERHKFNYSDPEAVASQLQKLRSAVRRYRNHPALLMWCCGIEVESGAGTNVAVYKAINDVARMVHDEDRNHPTTTAFADLGYNNVKAALAAQYCPELDIFGVNSYGGLATMADRLKNVGWTRPYMIMEFGPRGQWEVPKTAWNSEVEQMPLDKAAFYLESYNKSISSQENWCLGSFVFSWDYKFEGTPTWYSMHLPDGSRLNTADTMWRAWSSRDPTNRCPQIRWVGSSLDRQKVGPNKPYTLDVDAGDPDGDPLRYQWILMAEIKKKGADGFTSTDLKPIAGRITDETLRKAKIVTPTTAGAYRVFVYAYDGRGNASSANMPFYVEPATTVTKSKSTNTVSRR